MKTAKSRAALVVSKKSICSELRPLANIKSDGRFFRENPLAAFETLDRFCLSFAPLWFRWLGCGVLLGLISFAARQHSVQTLAWLSYFNYFVLFLYWSAYFHGADFLASRFAGPLRRALALTTAAALALATGVFIDYFVAIFWANMP